MRVKISEKHLLLGLVLFVIGVAIFFNTTVANWPVKISEKIILIDLVGIVSLVLGVRYLSRSFYKQTS